MSSQEQAAPRPPGRPRSAAADAAIVGAALQVLAEDGYRGLSMERVRIVAGVGKATLYRRFPSKAALAKAAMGYLHQDLAAPEDTGSLRGDLQVMQAAALEAARATQTPLILPRLLVDVADDPELHAIFRSTLADPRRAALRLVLERGVRRGELRGDVDLDVLVDLIAAPYLYRLVIDGGDIEPAFARREEYVEIVLRGAAP